MWGYDAPVALNNTPKPPSQTKLSVSRTMWGYDAPVALNNAPKPSSQTKFSVSKVYIPGQCGVTMPPLPQLYNPCLITLTPYQMEFVVGTSRFYDIVNTLENEDGIPGVAQGGATIPQLIEQALTLLERTGFNRRTDSIMYIGGGVPDVNTKLSGWGYQEVVSVGDPLEKANRIMCNIEDGARRIYDAGAVPVFATVTPMLIAKWNLTRQRQRKTHHLNYVEDYYQMQENQLETIHILNDYIARLNRSYHMNTPRLAGVVLQKRGARRRGAEGGQVYRLRESRLRPDGCHLTPETTSDWIHDTQRHYGH